MTNLENKLKNKIKKLAEDDIITTIESGYAPEIDESADSWYDIVGLIDWNEFLAQEKPTTFEKKESLINNFSWIFDETREKLIKKINFKFISTVASTNCQICGIENDKIHKQLIMITFEETWRTKILCDPCFEETGWKKWATPKN